jgi:hypothetical protein
MRGFLSNLFSVSLELITLAAVGGIAYGVSLIFLPAGIITGCVLLIAAVVDYGR